MFFLRGICKTSSILKVIYFVNQLLEIVFIIVPCGLILMISIDFLKNVISQNDDFKKNFQMAMKRVFMAVMMFLVPTIVNFSIALLGNLGVSIADCLENATLEKIATFENEEKAEKEASENGSSEEETKKGSSEK